MGQVEHGLHFEFHVGHVCLLPSNSLIWLTMAAGKGETACRSKALVLLSVLLPGCALPPLCFLLFKLQVDFEQSARS